MTQYRRKVASVDAFRWTIPAPDSYPAWLVSQVELLLNDGRLLLKNRDVVEAGSWIVLEPGVPVRVIEDPLFNDIYEAAP